LLFGVRDRHPASERPRIVVSVGRVERMAAAFEQFQRRPPTTEERQSLVDDYLREEIWQKRRSRYWNVVDANVCQGLPSHHRTRPNHA
jgi:hypothetical protein